MFNYSDYINSKVDTYAPTTTTEASKSLDKDAFLKLLVAQLGNQDPMNPMEDKEFTAQLAQFSSLEQLTNINEGISSLIDGTSRQEMLTAVSFIGKSVRAAGTSISKEGDSTSTVYYAIESPVQNIYVNIFDSFGNVVRTEELGQSQAGTFEYNWDGKDYKGKDLPDGVYTFSIAGEGVDGEAVLVATEVSGVVSGVASYEGHHYLRLKDGRVVDMLNVTEVVNPPSGTTDPTDGTTDPTDGTTDPDTAADGGQTDQTTNPSGV